MMYRFVLLGLCVLFGCTENSPTASEDSDSPGDDGISMACPPDPPAESSSFFPLQEGQQWQFQYSCTYESFSAVEYKRKVVGNLTWTFDAPRCEDTNTFTIEEHFKGQVTETWDYVYWDSIHVEIDSLHHVIMLEGRLDEEQIVIPGPDMGMPDGRCSPGLGTLTYTTPWHYPLAAPDTMRADSLLGAGFGSSSHASVILVRNEGVVQFGHSVGGRSSGWTGSLWRMP